ncbi:MAG: hypothetical protein ABEJ69_02945 [Candidatus Nanohaloarchaea archaeon]
MLHQGVPTEFYIRAAQVLLVYGFGVIVWRKGKRNNLRLTKLVSYFLFLMGTFWVGIDAVLYLTTTGVLPVGTEAVAAAGTGISHIFVFASLAMLWKAITVLYRSEYEKYGNIITGWGFLVALLGIGGALGLWSTALYSYAIPLGMVPFGIAIGVFGGRFTLKLKELSPDEAVKVGLLTAVGALLAIGGSVIGGTEPGRALLSTLGVPLWLAETSWVVLVGAAVYWDRLKEIRW